MSKKNNGSRIIKHRRVHKRWARAAGGYTSLRSISIFVLGVGLVGFASAVVVYARSRNVTFTPLPSITHTTDVPDTGELLRRINDERRGNNRTELVMHDRLKLVAEKRLQAMVDSQRYAHNSLDGKYYYDLLPEFGYTSSYSCENLDIEPSVQPKKFIQSWLVSTGGHKECMLNDKVAQVGIASGKFSRDDKTKQQNFLVVAIFAAKPSDAKASE
jgi:uncharacterized protein YkwD